MKKYISPSSTIIELQSEGALLAGSNLDESFGIGREEAGSEALSTQRENWRPRLWEEE